jgi:hypothetical protein
MERATRIEPVLPTWEGKYSALYFQHLQSGSRKMYVQALHTVHALPDLRIAGGRFGGRFLSFDGRAILVFTAPFLCISKQVTIKVNCKDLRDGVSSPFHGNVTRVVARAHPHADCC